MHRLLCTLAAFTLTACYTNPAPSQIQSDQAPGAVRSIIGEVDDAEAILDFLNKLDLQYDQPSNAAVVARTVEGGPAHPRITLVYMTDWCGSGGCTLLIIEPSASGLSELGRVTISYPPIRVLETRSHGMPDISVRVRGDYYPGDGRKFVALPFDGQTYALNPTMPPSRLLSSPVAGEVVISEQDVQTAFQH